MALLQVAVIGAGAAGLCALRHLCARPDVFSPVAYEMHDELGGTWVYNLQVGLDDKGRPIHSSMYKNLRTNLPKGSMAFPDFPFKEDLPSFMNHQYVKQYLCDYADYFNVKQHIQFQTGVMNVKPKSENGGAVKWQVTTRCHLTDPPTDKMSTFDAVIVCNGHYSVPIIPSIPGLSGFNGQTLHSHSYRDPADFTGQTVVCLGGSISGQDIGLDLAIYAKKVYLCHRHEALTTPLPPGLEQKPGIVRVHDDSMELEGGEVLAVDTLLLCTGYRYTFPFLSPECGVNVSEEERVTPLWKHLIHTRFPSLSFIGIPNKVCSFPQFDCQLQLVIRVLTGEVTLPSQADMEADDYTDRLSRGISPNRAHHLESRQWDYNDEIARIGGFTPLKPVVGKLCSYSLDWRRKDLQNYKNKEYKITSPETFVELKTN